MAPSHNILVLINESLYPQVIEPEIDALLDSLGTVRREKQAGQLSREAYRALFRDVDAVVGSWGTPLIDGEILDAAPRLKIIAYAAGSIKPVVAREVLERGVVVINAARAMALGVAEMTLLFALASLRRLVPLQLTGKAQRRWARDYPFEGLFYQPVGLVGFGQVGRLVVELFKPFQCRFRVYDPHLPPGTAEALGVERASLDEVLQRSRIVSLHAAMLPETRGLIGARELSLLRDGAILINTARGGLIDHEALAREAATGRIQVCLDVTEPEPLPPESPLWSMPNVVITPHIAGPTEDRRIDMGRDVITRMAAFLRGEPIEGAITPERYDTMA